MTLKNLKDALSNLARFAHIAGSKKSASDLQAVSEFLKGDPQGPANISIAELSSLINEFKGDITQTYIQRLTNAVKFDQFEPLFKELAADKIINKDDMDYIAHGYISARPKYRSRKAALDAIRDRFEERVYQASKMEIVDRYKVG